jgi:N-acetylglucosaminyl-diphospho-decaprenol L-rhamnosyltransferase
MALSVDVVIPVSNHWELTESCLAHLAGQTRAHRVIVGDNGSTDGTPERLARDWPDVHVLRTDAPQPFAVVCNAGVAHGDSDVVVLLNNDVDCETDFLERLIAPLERDAALGDVASLCLRPNRREIDSVGITCDATLSAFARLRGEPAERAGSPTPVLAGAAGTAGAYRRAAWEQVGGIDETFPAYHEDFELVLRLRAAGWATAAAPDAVCTHLGSASYGVGSPRQRFNAGFGRGYVIGRYGLHDRRTALTETIAVLGDSAGTRDLSALRGRVAGLRAARGLPRRARPEHAIDAAITMRDAFALRRGHAPRLATRMAADHDPAAAADAGCLACGASLAGAARIAGRDRMLATPGEFDVAICPSCASGTTLPRLEPEQLAALYPDQYGPYAEADPGLLAAVSRTIRAVQGRLAMGRFPLAAIASRPRGRGLDVGCGRGDLAAELVNRGWAMTGVEPSENACAAARARGVDARAGTLATVALEPEAYDAIVFQHSLEHTLDPEGDLEKVRAALAPGGVLAITVPNFGSWQRRRFGSRWFHLDLPRHRTHFTRQGLERAVRDAGLEVDEVRTSTSTVGLPGTLQYAVAGRCLFPGGLRLRVAAGLCILVLPLARLLDRLHGGGDQLHIIARRPAF